MESYEKTYREHRYRVVLQHHRNDFAVFRYKDEQELSYEVYGLRNVAKTEYKKYVELLKVMK